jgi:hypothetical protein
LHVEEFTVTYISMYLPERDPSSFMIQPRSGVKILWECIGVVLILLQVVYEGFGILCDIYFVIDLIVRFRTGRHLV